MRKLIFNIFLFVGALNLLFLVSCEEDGDDIVNTGPEIAIQVNGESGSSSVDAGVGETVTVNVDVTDDDGVDSVIVRKVVNGTVGSTETFQAGTGSFSQDVDVTIEGSDIGGDVVIEIEAFDSEGNSNVQTITVNIAPVMNYTAVLLYAPLANEQSKSFFSVTNGQTYSLGEIEGIGSGDGDTTGVGGGDPTDTTGVDNPGDTTGVGTPGDTTGTDTTGTGGVGTPGDTTDTGDSGDTVDTGGSTGVASSLIDFGYYYGATNNATLASPAQINAIGGIYDLSGWTTLNQTQFRKTTIQESEFLENADSIGFISGAFDQATAEGDSAQVTDLQVGDVIAFKLDDAQGGHTGIMRVSNLQPGAGENNFIELEVLVAFTEEEGDGGDSGQ